MYRGTNPIIEMELNCDTSLIEVMYVTFKQGNGVVFEKEASACTFDGTKASVQLTQEETLLLKAGVPLLVQVRVKLTDGRVMASEIERLNVLDVFKEGVI